jgi:TolA-binding protein
MTELKDKVYFNIGESFYNLKDYQNALNSYQVLIDGYPDSPLADQALFKIGLSLFQEKSYKEAIHYWKWILSGHPDFSRRDEVIYWIGEANLLLKNYAEATSYFRELANNGESGGRRLHTLVSWLKPTQSMISFPSLPSSWQKPTLT